MTLEEIEKIPEKERRELARQKIEQALNLLNEAQGYLCGIFASGAQAKISMAVSSLYPYIAKPQIKK